MKQLLKVFILMLLLGGIALGTLWSQEQPGPAATSAPATAPASPSATADPSTAPAAPPERRAPFASVGSGTSAGQNRGASTGSPTAAGGTGVPRPAGATGAGAGNYQRDPYTTMVSISFFRADILNVLGFLSLAAGVPIVADAAVTGTITITAVQQVPLAVAYEVINSALRARGYTMVGTLQDTMIRVVALQQGVADRAPVRVGADVAKIGLGDSMITQVVPLQYVSATQIKTELQPLVSATNASLVADSASNYLIITDSEGNVRRLVELINVLDKDSSGLQEVEVYPCKYASASVLLPILQAVFPAPTPQTTQQPNQGAAAFFRRGPGGGNQPPTPGAAGANDTGVLSMMGQIRLSADARTNSIIIVATRSRIDMVVELIKKLDVNTTSEVSARIFPLLNADATLIAQQLTNLFQQPQQTTTSGPGGGGGGGRPAQTTQPTGYAGLKQNMIVADVRTNSVVVTATTENMAQFESMIHELDAANVLSGIMRVFPLRYAKAADVQTTLNQLFSGNVQGASVSLRDVRTAGTQTGNAANQQGSPLASLRNITVVADTKTNSVLVTGPPQSFMMVQDIIQQLDTRSLQVFIQVAIVDVTLDDSTKFGVEWKWNNSAGTAPSTIGPDLGLTDGLRYSVISGSLQALLQSLKTNSNVRVYSTPSITTADNVQASISIGTQEPYITSQEDTVAGGVLRTVAFQNVSIALTVTPHVSEAVNLISLEVDQTINEILGTNRELNAPRIASRQARTTVMVDDGQTIVIGGIIKDNRVRTVNGVPVLQDIPILGELFKSRSWTTGHSELMVFLTPHILRDAKSVAERTQQETERLSVPGDVSRLTK